MDLQMIIHSIDEVLAMSSHGEAPGRNMGPQVWQPYLRMQQCLLI
jgi:hypothetical protein